MEKAIFNGFENLRTDELRKMVADEFKESTIAFEHGYKPPHLTSGGTILYPMYIDSKGVHCKGKEKNSYNATISFDNLTKAQLVKICKMVNEYYNYCLNEA